MYSDRQAVDRTDNQVMLSSDSGVSQLAVLVSCCKVWRAVEV